MRRRANTAGSFFSVGLMVIARLANSHSALIVASKLVHSLVRPFDF